MSMEINNTNNGGDGRENDVREHNGINGIRIRFESVNCWAVCYDITNVAYFGFVSI